VRFEEYFLEQKNRHQEDLFYDPLMDGAYITGAFAAAIVHYSWEGVYQKNEETGQWEQVNKVSQNESFKKWLSIRPINRSNLLQIRDKAEFFMRRFGLLNSLTKELAELSTRYFLPKRQSAVSDAEVSFAFSRGYYDLMKFLK